MVEPQSSIITAFQRFFNSAVRPRLSNSIIETEWTYFVALMRKYNTEKERVDMYLKILESQEKAKEKTTRPTLNTLNTLNNFSLLNRAHKLEVCGSTNFPQNKQNLAADTDHQPHFDKYEKYRSISNKVQRNQSMFQSNTSTSNTNQSQAISTKRVPQFGGMNQRLYETVELKMEKRVSLPTKTQTRPLSRDKYEAIYARLIPSVQILLRTFEDVQNTL